MKEQMENSVQFEQRSK